MPYIDIPERDHLHMWYCVNELPKNNDDTPQSIDPAKQNVVLVHASTSSSALSFSAQFSDPRLLRAFNLIAFDMPLHGKTRIGPQFSHKIPDSADCLIAALDKLDLDSYSLVGEGFFGTNICSWVAIKRPQKVRALFLISPGPLKEDAETANSITEEWLPMAARNKDGKGDGTGNIPDEALKILGDYLFSQLHRQEDRNEQYTKTFQERYGSQQPSSEGLVHLSKLFLREPILPDLLASIKAPCLILQGETDTVASPLAVAVAWQKFLKSSSCGD